MCYSEHHPKYYLGPSCIIISVPLGVNFVVIQLFFSLSSIGCWQTSRVRPVQDTSALEIGNLVAVYREETQSLHEPWMGRLEGVNNVMVDVGWLKGSYNGRKQSARPHPVNRRKKME